MNPFSGKYIIWVKGERPPSTIDWWWPHVAYDDWKEIVGAYNTLLEQCSDNDIVITRRLEKPDSFVKK